MNERELANKIKQELNYATGQLDSRVLDGLKAARERAVDICARQMVHQPSLAYAGNHGSHSGLFARKWLSAATLLLVLIAGAVWQQQYMAQQDDDVDAALLASDLPLNAFVDQNFHLWLDQSPQH